MVALAAGCSASSRRPKAPTSEGREASFNSEPRSEYAINEGAILQDAGPAGQNLKPWQEDILPDGTVVTLKAASPGAPLDLVGEMALTAQKGDIHGEITGNLKLFGDIDFLAGWADYYPERRVLDPISYKHNFEAAVGFVGTSHGRNIVQVNLWVHSSELYKTARETHMQTTLWSVRSAEGKIQLAKLWDGFTDRARSVHDPDHPGIGLCLIGRTFGFRVDSDGAIVRVCERLRIGVRSEGPCAPALEDDPVRMEESLFPIPDDCKETVVVPPPPDKADNGADNGGRR
jgi:hypothetical protein